MTTDRTPAQRIGDTGAILSVDDEGNVTYDTARLLSAVENNPALLDDITAVFGAEAAEEVSALVEQVREQQEGSWLSRWWRCTAAFVGAVGVAAGIWLATDHWPIIYTARIIWHFFRRVVL